MRFELPTPTPDQILPEPEGLCPDCQGRGWMVVADGGAGTAQACPCKDKERVPQLLKHCGIPQRYLGCTLSNFNTHNSNPRVRDALIRALRITERYVERFLNTDGSFCEAGLLYIGPPGIGKTHLAAAVLQQLIKTYRLQGRFVDFTSLIHQIQATFEPTSLASKRQVLDPVINAEILVFDELGAQKPTEWVRDTLYFIINTRYTRRLPTIFTSNYPLDRGTERPEGAVRRPTPGSDADITQRNSNIEELKRRVPAPDFELLESRISSALVSRLYQMAQPIILGGLDYRREVKTPRLGS